MLRLKPVLQLMVVVIAISHCQVAFGDISQRSLQKLTENLIAQGGAPVDPPKFIWDEPSLIYFLGYVGCDCPDTWQIPLQAQFQVTLIRRYRNDRSQRRFWSPILRDVESEIGEMLRLIQRGNMNENELSKALLKRGETIRQLYQNNLSDLAKKNGKQGANSGAPKFLRFSVTFISEPLGATIHLVSAVDEEIYDYFTNNNLPLNGWKPQKIMINAGRPRPLYGKYILRATWKNGRSAKDIITVAKDGRITVMPD